MQGKKVGLITEGITDQAILQNILIGFFSPTEVDIRPLQPLRDETGRGSFQQQESSFGGWEKVFEYVRSERLKEALQFLDFLVIQVDTDQSDHPNFGVSPLQTEDGREKPFDIFYQDILRCVKSKIPLFSVYEARLFFALGVHSSECWLLPLFEPQRAGETKGCFEKLVRAVHTKERLKSSLQKTKRDYDAISKEYRKKRDLLERGKKNPSLAKWLEEMERMAEVAEQEAKPVLSDESAEDSIHSEETKNLESENTGLLGDASGAVSESQPEEEEGKNA